MNPVLANLPASERPETLCSACNHAIWYVGAVHTEKATLAAFCGLLGQKTYSGSGDVRTVQACTTLQPDE